MSFGPGTVFKHYRIERLIGKGGMGEVYLAEETTLGRKVAIKVLKQEATADPKFVERFRNEARMLGQLNHPNIVGLYSFFEDGGTYYLVMQYAPGITLAELIRRTGPIPEQRAMRIFAQLAEALTFAHGEGIVHRDIKPSNIMVDPDRSDRVLVMDFGIARMMDSQHITRTGAQVGTPCYMSPEQVLGKKDIGPASDVYSSGVLLYEMLAGSLPYDMEVDSLYTIQDRILKEPLPDPRLRYEYISDRGVALVKALTQKEHEKRPQSMREAGDGTYINQGTPIPKPVVSIPIHKHDVDIKQPQPIIPDVPAPNDIVEDPLKPGHPRGKFVKVLGVMAVAAVIVMLVFIIPRKRPRVDGSVVDGSNDTQVVPEMIQVEGGTFMMGSNHQGGLDEGPVHQVSVSSFLIGNYEVTQKEWRDVMGSNPSEFAGDDLPVEQVSWYDVVDYCNKRSLIEGLTPCYSGSGDSISCKWNANGYRLPSEAEWEFAARGGTKSKGYTYSGANDLGSVGWYGSNTGETTHPVGSKSPNELGLFDMSGNVWEWCWDWYDDGYYAESRSLDPTGSASGLYRLIRGGSWTSGFDYCRVASRYITDPGGRFDNYGFRVARAIF